MLPKITQTSSLQTNAMHVYDTTPVFNFAQPYYIIECTVKNAVELLGAFRPDVEKIQYH
jgi:hypothetical protein